MGYSPSRPRLYDRPLVRPALSSSVGRGADRRSSLSTIRQPRRRGEASRAGRVDRVASSDRVVELAGPCRVNGSTTQRAPAERAGRRSCRRRCAVGGAGGARRSYSAPTSRAGRRGAAMRRPGSVTRRPMRTSRRSDPSGRNTAKSPPAPSPATPDRRSPLNVPSETATTTRVPVGPGMTAGGGWSSFASIVKRCRTARLVVSLTATL